MADYLIEQYNEKTRVIQDREAKALAGALAIYADATNKITETAALERLDAGMALAAAMSQRDHEYQNGRPEHAAPPPVEDPLPRAAPLGFVFTPPNVGAPLLPFGCSYPNCTCAISFPDGYTPSEATECPRCARETDSAMKEQTSGAIPDV